MIQKTNLIRPWCCIAFSAVLLGCGKPEYQPPKDAIPSIPTGKTESTAAPLKPTNNRTGK